jgi:hypothetical protein
MLERWDFLQNDPGDLIFQIKSSFGLSESVTKPITFLVFMLERWDFLKNDPREFIFQNKPTSGFSENETKS